jgi:predicted TIM-barrel fold metal-dependent hydrolase
MIEIDADHTEGMRGWKEPEWTFEQDQAFSDAIGVETRIFSVSTPGVSFIKNAKESGEVAREMNHYCAKIRDLNPKTCGFFATIPPMHFAAEAVAEIKYAYENLHPDGVTLFTSYGDDAKYLGHEDFVPVWRELNAHSAVIFVHPCDRGADAQLINDHLPGPAFDWPHETGRTAMDLITSHRLEQFPNVRIILSHGGGTLPLLIRRSTLISLPVCGEYMAAEDLYSQAKRFYFDLALSCSREALPLLLDFVPEGHLLFGSDYPHATEGFSKEQAEFLDQYPIDDQRRRDIYSDAAKVLFARLGK